MKSPLLNVRRVAAWIVAVSIGAPVVAQFDEDLIIPPRSDGSVWAQSLAPKRTVGSASLAFIDMGPIGPLVFGLHARWLEWTNDHVWVGQLDGGGSASSVEVTQPPGLGGPPIAGCLGAATLHSGWIVTTSGGPVGVAPRAGAFVWTQTKLFAIGYDSTITAFEVLTPTGSPMSGVLGVSVIDSFIVDASFNPMFVQAEIHASALVYTPSRLFHVRATMMNGLVWTTTSEILQPGGIGSIASVRGVNALVGGPDPLITPPMDSLGAALVWNPLHLYLVQLTPAPTIIEVFNPYTLTPIASCWGVTHLGAGTLNPVRAAAQVWQPDHTWIVSFESPTLTLYEATQAPGFPVDPPIVSDVKVPGMGLIPLVERQASFLYEIIGTMTINGFPGRALIIGQNQREF